MSQIAFEKLPQSMQYEELIPYIDLLNKKRVQLFFKRTMDICLSVFTLLLTSPFFLIIALCIKIDSRGPVFFRQVRVGKNRKNFRIFKFRTMVQDAEKLGMQITVGKDPRITRVGRLLRKTRLDEFPQFINVLKGDMSFVGARPEVPRYVDEYTPEQLATLLMRPGLTGSASIEFKDENALLENSEDPQKTYVEKILPEKMRINLEYIKSYSLWGDFVIILKTLRCILG